jgi:hypothetical protein
MGDKIVFSLGVGEDAMSKMNGEGNLSVRNSCRTPDQQLFHLFISDDVTGKSSMLGKVSNHLIFHHFFTPFSVLRKTDKQKAV